MVRFNLMDRWGEGLYEANGVKADLSPSLTDNHNASSSSSSGLECDGDLSSSMLWTSWPPPASSTIKSDLTHARVGFTTNDRKPLRWCSACDLMWNFSVTPQWLTSVADVCRSPRSVPAVCSKTECFADCDQNAACASAENALRATVLFYSLILYNVQVEEGEAVNAGKFSRVQFFEIIQTTFWISNWRGASVISPPTHKLTTYCRLFARLSHSDFFVLFLSHSVWSQRFNQTGTLLY